MFTTWNISTNSNIHTQDGVVMSKKSTYMGGEEDKQKNIVPKRLEKFFNKKVLFLILGIILLLLIQLFTGV